MFIFRRMQRVSTLSGNKEIAVNFKIGRFERVAVQQNIKDGNIERFLDLVEQRVRDPETFDVVIKAAISSVTRSLRERIGVPLGGACVGTLLGVLFAGPLGAIPGAILGGAGGVTAEFGFTKLVAHLRSPTFRGISSQKK